jgi:superfamily II DNA or RNA helicase
MGREVVELIVGNIETEIRGKYPYDEVDDATSFHRKGYFHMPAYKQGRWDGREHLLRRRRFPSGLLPAVLSVLEEEGIEYVVEDLRDSVEAIDLQPFAIDGIKLRDYQINTVGQMLKNLRGFAQIPTGGGKTLIAAAVIKALSLPTAYIVHTSTLFRQTEEVFRDVLPSDELGFVGAGNYNFNKYTICMVQTLMRLINREEVNDLLLYKVLFVDECHHVHSNGSKASWYVAQRYFKNASIRFGLSATPTLKKHGMLLQAATGPLIHKVKLTELQEKGYASKVDTVFHRVDVSVTPEEVFPEFKMDDYEELEDPTRHLRAYAEDYQKHIIEGRTRNLKIAKLALSYAKNGNLVLIFTERIAHGNLLDLLINFSMSQNNSIKHKFLCGKNSSKEIEFYKNEAKEKRLDILIVTRQLFGEGVDIPAVNVLMNAAGGNDLSAFTQMFGRGLRVTNDKKTVQYVDFYDSGSTHLENHSKARIRHLKKLGQKDVKFR